MAEAEQTASEPDVTAEESRFHQWAVGLSGRQKILIFWVPILVVMFVIVFPPTFEAWINRIEPKVGFLPWSIFITHTLLFLVAIWIFVLQRVDNAQAVERGEI